MKTAIQILGNLQKCQGVRHGLQFPPEIIGTGDPQSKLPSETSNFGRLWLSLIDPTSRSKIKEQVKMFLGINLRSLRARVCVYVCAYVYLSTCVCMIMYVYLEIMIIH